MMSFILGEKGSARGFWAAALTVLGMYNVHAAECVQYNSTLAPFTCSANRMVSFDLADIDEDGDDEIVYACYLESSIKLMQALGSKQTDYTTTTITSFGNVAPFPAQVLFKDIDLDGYIDIYAVGGLSEGTPQPSQAAWFRNPGTDPFAGSWEIHVVDRNRGVPGFLEDLTGDGYPDFVVRSVTESAAIKVFVNPGEDVLSASTWEARQIPFSELGVPAGQAGFVWMPAELDGDPATTTLLGVSSGSYVIRYTLTDSLTFERQSFFPQLLLYPGYPVARDIDGDGRDELLAGGPSGSVLSVSIPPSGSEFSSKVLVASSDIVSVQPEVIDANGDDFPDLILNNVNATTSSPLSRLATANAPGVFDDRPSCGLQPARAGELKGIGRSPQQLLRRVTGGFQIGTPTPSATARFDVPGTQPTIAQPGEQITAYLVVENVGTASLGPSTYTLTPSTSTVTADDTTVDFPALPPGESAVMPFTFSVDEMVECGSSFKWTFVGDFGGQATLPQDYSFTVGRVISADRTFSDPGPFGVPDGTGSVLTRFLQVPPLSLPVNGYTVKASIESVAGNRLNVLLVDDSGLGNILYDSTVGETGTLSLERTTVAEFSTGAEFVLFVRDKTTDSPAILKNWSITVKRPRTECVPPNQSRLVDLLLGLGSGDGSTYDTNADGTFDSGDLPIYFPD